MIDPLTQTTLGAATAISLDSSQNMTPRHQGDKNTGGTDKNLRVLNCFNVDLSLDYEGLYLIMKNFGDVERMKLVLSHDKMTFNLYTTFISSVSANEANRQLNGHSVNGRKLVTKLYNSKNLENDEFDYLPTNYEQIVKEQSTKDPPNLVWHVATFKEGKDNMIKAAECIQRKVGKIPENNLKRYGKGILIKAGNDTQSALLTNFRPPESSNILQITPHSSFNTQRAIIYSKDLYEYSEEEILNMCPSNVCEVRKLKGSNNAIMLILTSRFHMDSILFNHVRIKVKKYRPNPTQCRNCFEYGHILSSCSNKQRCCNCSGLHENGNCDRPRFCFQCDGAHSPNDKRCPRFRFEQEIRETINSHHVSVGEAKRIVLGANKLPNSTFASVIQGRKASSKNKNATTSNAQPKPQPNHSNDVSTPLSDDNITPVTSQSGTASLSLTTSSDQHAEVADGSSQRSDKNLSSSNLRDSAEKKSRPSSKPCRSNSVERQKSSRSPVRSSTSPQSKKLRKSPSTMAISDPITTENSLPESSSSTSGAAANDDMSVDSGELVSDSAQEHQKSFSKSMAHPSHSDSRPPLPSSSSRGRPTKLTRDVDPSKSSSSQSKQGKTGGSVKPK